MVSHQFLALLDAPFHTHLLHLVVGLAGHGLFGEIQGQIDVEGLWHHCDLAHLGQRFDAGNDGYGDTCLPCLLHEVKVSFVVEEELCHGVFGAHVLFHLQEVDINSARSYGTDERTILRDVLPGASDSFAYNFNTLFVPYPLPPMGHVESGLYTLSAAAPRISERISLPVPFSWPIRLFNLKRCLLVSRFPVAGTDKELVLINLHLEAYDSGEGKEAQTKQLVSLMQDEYAKGNYVIAGGDFNQRFTNIDQSAYPVYDGMWQPGVIDASSFGSGFTLLMDNAFPTCRSLDRAYAGAEKEGFQFYLIDGFIVSSNVKAESVETLDYGFVCSDHNPVRMTFILE